MGVFHVFYIVQMVPATLLKLTLLHGCFSHFLYCTNGTCNFTKINTPPWVFFTFLYCTNGTKSLNASHLLKQKIM